MKVTPSVPASLTNHAKASEVSAEYGDAVRVLYTAFRDYVRAGAVGRKGKGSFSAADEGVEALQAAWDRVMELTPLVRVFARAYSLDETAVAALPRADVWEATAGSDAWQHDADQADWLVMAADHACNATHAVTVAIADESAIASVSIAAMAVEGAGPDSGGMGQPDKPSEPREWLPQAVALVSTHPNWTDRTIAGRVGIHPSQLSRDTTYQTARTRATAGSKSQVRRGFRDADTGAVEAVDDRDGD
jgi:hypothetical protein